MAEKAKPESKPVKKAAAETLKTKPAKTAVAKTKVVKTVKTKSESKSKETISKEQKSKEKRQKELKTRDIKSRESQKAKMKRKKVNLTRLYTEMNKRSLEANDKEIIKRFKIIIDSSEEDLPKISVDSIIKDPASVDFSSYHESFQPYIKHYLYMIKRDRSKAAK